MVFVSMLMVFKPMFMVFVLMFMVFKPMFMVFVLMFMVFKPMFMVLVPMFMVFKPMFMVLVPMFIVFVPMLANIALVSDHGLADSADSADIARRTQVARRRTGVGTPASRTTPHISPDIHRRFLRSHRSMRCQESRMLEGSLMA